MLKVDFYESIDISLIEFVVIISKYKDKWVFCKHKTRDTYEFPGGHVEPNEDILTAAKRELWEETGAVEYEINQVGIYSVEQDNNKTYGVLFYAEINKLEPLPNFEIERIILLNDFPNNWTYPLIEPYLIEKITNYLSK